MGRVMFNAEGRMMAVTCDGRPQLPAGTVRAYSSYCVLWLSSNIKYLLLILPINTRTDVRYWRRRIGGAAGTGATAASLRAGRGGAALGDLSTTCWARMRGRPRPCRRPGSARVPREPGRRAARLPIVRDRRD
jgi:hypothetical protein